MFGEDIDKEEQKEVFIWVDRWSKICLVNHLIVADSSQNREKLKES